MAARPFAFLLAAAAALLPAAPGGHAALGPADPGRFTGIYDLYVGGLKGGEMALEATQDAGRYRASASGMTAGFIAYLWRAGFVATTEGRVGEAGPVPERFEADSYSRETTREIAIRYEAGRPAEVAIVIEPPEEPKPWALDPLAQKGAFDPLSGVLAGLALQRAEGLCERTVEMFDGRRRYAIDLGPPVAEDGQIRCPALYRRVAGFEPEFMARPDWPFDIWFEPGPGGLWHIVKARGEMSIGIASLALRGD